MLFLKKTSVRLYILLALLFLKINLIAQYKIVNIDDYTFAPNEPSIFINPADPSKIVAGSNIYNQYFSIDTGHTWKWKRLESSFGVYGDPVIYADELGNFYFCHLAASKQKKYPHWFDRIVIQKSTDGGANFNNGTFAGLNGNKDQDKPWIISDTKSKMHKGNIYVSWTEFDKYESNDPNDFSRIKIARSINRSESFENAITVSDTTGNCMDDDNTLEGATAAIGENGEVYIAWAGHGKIYFDKSLDGGLTWGKDKIAAIQEGGWVLEFDQIYRCNGMPFIVADNSGGKYNNRLYIVWGEYLKKEKGEIKLIYSDNGGDSWSKEITVNNSFVGDQFLPHIAVDQTDGNVYVVFYDRRNSQYNIATDVYVAYSTDGGNSFNNNLITPSPFFTPGTKVFFGDYNGISAHSGIIRPIWTNVENKRMNIQTAILSKELLQNYNQVLNDSFVFYYYKNDNKNMFVFHSNVNAKVEIVLKVKKNNDSIFSKTYKKKSRLYQAKNEILFHTIKGKSTELTVVFNGKTYKYTL